MAKARVYPPVGEPQSVVFELSLDEAEYVASLLGTGNFRSITRFPGDTPFVTLAATLKDIGRDPRRFQEGFLKYRGERVSKRERESE